MDPAMVSATLAAIPDGGIVGPPPPPGGVEDDALEGRVWGLTFIDGADGRREALAGAEVNLLLIDGKVSGSAGCNTMAGDYQRDGDRLSFGALSTTRIACALPAGVMQQEAEVLDALGEVAAFVATQGLVLVDESGQPRLHFLDAASRPRDPHMQPPTPPSP
jgi:heat shock protein HslJ